MTEDWLLPLRKVYKKLSLGVYFAMMQAMDTMIKVYHGPLDKPWPLLWFLAPNYPDQRQTRGRFGDEVWDYFDKPLVDIVQDPSQADFLLIPYTYNVSRHDREYIQHFSDVSSQLNKKVIVVFPGDSNESVNIPDAIVFRNSQYKSKLKANEIIMPAVADDLLGDKSMVVREKKSKPVIGFCGWADFKSVSEIIKYWIKSNLYRGVYKQGLWFRRQALSLLEQSPLVTPNFIIRQSYSGNEKTILLDKDQARTEYIENITQSDFTLCPKGDGNFSIRFFEVLSLGRIPVLVDTDYPLPLESFINYDDIIIRVDYRKISELDQIVVKTYQSWSELEFTRRQKLAREVFTSQLRLDKFFAKTLTKDFLNHYDAR